MSVTVTPYFVPTSITGCRLWLDAADSATIGFSSGSNVNQWADKSGNGLHASNTSLYPTYTGSNLVFNGLKQLLLPPFIPTATQNITIATVWTCTSASTGGAFQSIIEQTGTASGTWWRYMIQGYTFGGRNAYMYGINEYGDNPVPISNFPTFVIGTPNLSFISQTSANGVNFTLSNFASGSLYGTQTYGTGVSAGSQASIGSNTNGEPFTGTINEIIIYNAALSTTDRQKVEAYLAQKWALTSSLPAGHPGVNSILYRSSIPTPVKVTGYNSVSYTFAPSQISNCQLWLDSFDPLGTGTAPSYGATFTTLADKSGNSRNFSVNTGSTYYCNYESRPSIFISNSIMYASNAVDLTSYTVFIVCQSSNYADNQTAFVAMTGVAGCNDYNSLDSFGFYVDAATNRNRFYGSINANYVLNSLTAVGVNYYPLSQTCYSSTSGGSLLSYANGNVGGSQNSSITRTGTATGFAIGCDYVNDATKFYSTSPKVFINEIIVYNFVLSDVQRRQVEAYLSQKWGLTISLPAGHTGLTVPYYVNQSLLIRAARTIPVAVKTTDFTPTFITGCQMWLDGADRSTMFQNTAGTTPITTDGQTIAAWKDKSSNAYVFTQATTGNQPTYKVNIQNGCSLTRWNGTSTGLQSSTSIPFYTSASSGGSFFFVFMITSNSSQRFLMTYQNQTSGTFCVSESEIGCPTGNVDAGNFGIHQGCSKANVALNQLTTNTYVLMNLNLLSSGTAPANTTIFKNGTSSSMTAQNGGFYSGTTYPNANNARFLNIGYRVPVGTYPIDCWLAGDIAEIVWYQNPVTDSQRQQVEGYLAQKWGLTSSLPAGHPGKTSIFYRN